MYLPSNIITNPNLQHPTLTFRIVNLNSVFSRCIGWQFSSSLGFFVKLTVVVKLLELPLGVWFWAFGTHVKFFLYIFWTRKKKLDTCQTRGRRTNCLATTVIVYWFILCEFLVDQKSSFWNHTLVYSGDGKVWCIRGGVYCTKSNKNTIMIPKAKILNSCKLSERAK